MLDAAKEEQDLFDALEQITQTVIEPETEKETREDIKKTLTRFKTIMTKKDKVIKATGEQVKSLKLSTEAIKHDTKMQDEILEEQKKDIEKVQKKNYKMTKEKVEVLKELEVMREYNDTLNKANTDMIEQLRVKENLVKSLKEELGIDNDEEDEEVTEEEDEEDTGVVQEVTESVVRMNNDENNHTCNACNKQFRTSQDLENHVQSKHVEKKCDYCENVFANESELGKHHKECNQIGLASKKCNKCNLKFTIQGLRRHKPMCHGNKKEFDCPDCGMIFTSTNDVKKHQDEDHKMEAVRSREVCFHWTRGQCLKGESCRFSHVGRQNTARPKSVSTDNTRVPLCKNGASCDWLARGSCSYFHPRIGVQKPWTVKDNGGGGQRTRDTRDRQQPSSTQTQRGRRPFTQDNRPDCKFDGLCAKIPNCPDIHSLQVFPLFQGRRNITGMRNQGMRRN